MISKAAMSYLKLTHGIYNTVIVSLFIYQGWLGLKIRKGRNTGKIKALKEIKKHRKNGPPLVILSTLGFCAGTILVYIDKGDLLKYQLHLINGIVIAISINITLLISTKINDASSPWRYRHLLLGLFIICLYLLQVLLGLDILL